MDNIRRIRIGSDKVGFDFDERGGLFSRRVLEMMYEMEPERVERLVFLPYLDRMFLECGVCKKGRYWGFLLKQYPIIYYNEGDVYDPEVTTPESLVYEIILNKKELTQYDKLDDFGWIGNYSNCSHTDWVWAYEDYLKDEAFTGEKNRVTETTEAELALVRKDDLPLDYKLCFGEPDFAGSTYEIDVEAVLDDLDYYGSLDIVDDLSNPKFPLHIEYKKVLDYCLKLKERAEKKKKSTSLFDD